MALQLAKLSGDLPVVGVDLFDSRLKISMENGADYAFNPSKVDLEKEVKEITDGKGANVVIRDNRESPGDPIGFKNSI